MYETPNSTIILTYHYLFIVLRDNNIIYIKRYFYLLSVVFYLCLIVIKNV